MANDRSAIDVIVTGAGSAYAGNSVANLIEQKIGIDRTGAKHVATVQNSRENTDRPSRSR